MYEVYVPVLEKAFRTGETCSLQTDLFLPGQGTRNLIITCAPLLSGVDEVREVVGITQDLTEHVQEEQNRLQFERQLQRAL